MIGNEADLKDPKNYIGPVKINCILGNRELFVNREFNKVQTQFKETQVFPGAERDFHSF